MLTEETKDQTAIDIQPSKDQIPEQDFQTLASQVQQENKMESPAQQQQTPELMSGRAQEQLDDGQVNVED